MHVAQLLFDLGLAPDHEVVKPPLPNVLRWESRVPERALELDAWATRRSQQGVGKALLENLHDGGGIAAFGLAQQQVDVFGHDDVSEDDEAVAAADLFEKVEEEVAAAFASQQGSTLIATAGDEVEITGTVVAAQSSGHGKSVGKIKVKPV